MNKTLVNFLENFSLIMAANMFSMLISVIITFLVPHYFSKEAYSYFQLENLYCGYIWIISLGWNDGLYIKFGGERREDLDKKKLSSLFMVLALYLFIIGFILFGLFELVNDKPERHFVLIMALISVLIEIFTISITNLLQATNAMKQYAKISIFDRSCYILIVVTLLFTQKLDFHYLIIADIISKTVTLGLAVKSGKDFLFFAFQSFKNTWKDVKDIISIGISVSLASYASRMINNIVQLAIENVWGLLVFGKVALTLSISNMFSKFVAAVSIVLFPTLRRTEEKKRIDVYHVLSTFLTTLMLGMFCFYTPIKFILGVWLPDYQESLHYMAILLPISLFETRVTMLINTYLKILRKEREILYCNLLTVVCSVIFAFFGAFVVHSFVFMLVMIVVLLAFRCLLEEYRLRKYILVKNNDCAEVLMCIIFIFTSWKLNNLLGTMCYILSYIIYVYMNRKKIQEALFYVKKIAKV